MSIDVAAAGAEPRTFDERLGKEIHTQLWDRKIKQTEFAVRYLGISQSALSLKLRGERPFFAGELSVIAAALGVSVADLMPPVVLTPDGGNDNGAAGAPTRARTWDLRIIRPLIAA